MKNSRVCVTPGTPGFTFVKPEIASELKVDQQKLYRSGVGMLLYLLKHSRPNLSNPIRELSKGMDLTGLVHMKELKRVVKYVIETKEKGLKMVPNNSNMWELMALSDRDFAADKVKRVSVTGYVILSIFYGDTRGVEEQRAKRSYIICKRSRICGTIGGGERDEIHHPSSRNNGN